MKSEEKHTKDISHTKKTKEKSPILKNRRKEESTELLSINKKESENMKGLGLPIKAIVILILAILLLFIITSFILSESLEQMSKAEAIETFTQSCNNYKQLGCEWELTKQPEFQTFLQACRIVYGDYHTEYSCLYKFCCMETTDIECSAKCNICIGNKKVGLDIQNCCLDYNSKCTEDCSVC